MPMSTIARWSADSSTVYFDWRKPGEDEAGKATN
jgi:hypothetical protein